MLVTLVAPTSVTGEWKVSHDNPLGNSNNCVQATSSANLYTGSANKDLNSCLDDIRIWMQAHPTHGPVMVKIEMKDGFLGGLNATEFDSYVKAHLGSTLYSPANLLTKSDGTLYPNLDAAAQADNWPAYGSLEGKVIVEMIPGTVEQAVEPSSTWVDVVYAQHLLDLYNSGSIANAAVFPSVLGAQSGDPRARYSNTALRPWFVVFDGDAATWVNDGNTQWYDTNHYLAVVTDAENVSPALSDTAPSLADAQARVAELAADGASFVSTDWNTARHQDAGRRRRSSLAAARAHERSGRGEVMPAGSRGVRVAAGGGDTAEAAEAATQATASAAAAMPRLLASRQHASRML